MNGISYWLQTPEESNRDQIEEFLYLHGIGHSSLDRLTGLHRHKDPEVISYKKILAHEYTNKVLRNRPCASIIAIEEFSNQLVGLNLSTILEVDKDTDIRRYFNDWSVAKIF